MNPVNDRFRDCKLSGFHAAFCLENRKRHQTRDGSISDADELIIDRSVQPFDGPVMISESSILCLTLVTDTNRLKRTSDSLPHAGLS